jgi:SusD family
VDIFLAKKLQHIGQKTTALPKQYLFNPQFAKIRSGFCNFAIGKNSFLPIPQQDLNINNNLRQNPGW